MYQFPLYPETIPDSLKPGAVWVCCDREKVPMVADKRSQRAKSSDPSTWRTFACARGACEAGWHAGVGRVIVKDEGFVGIDLDHCRNAETGAITPSAREILERLDSYSEVSPSGTGVKVWVRAALERSYVKPGLEVYARGRYFTVTGQILPQYAGSPQERTEELREVIAKEFPRQRKRRRRSWSRAAEGQAQGRRLDLDGLLQAAGIPDPDEVGDDEAEIKYMVVCPWSHEHTTDPESGTYVGQYPSGALFFHCYHAHCAARRWPEFRRAVAPRRIIPINRPGYTGNITEVRINHGSI